MQKGRYRDKNEEYPDPGLPGTGGHRIGRLGQLTSGVEFLKWLTWGESIGFDTVNLNLSIIQLSFSFKMQVNVLQVLLIAAALLLYKKIK